MTYHTTIWPVGQIPWPIITGPDFYAPTRARLLKAAGLESVWVVGQADGPIRFGSAKDPREMWTRLQTASTDPVYVHDLRWAQGMLGRRLARALQKTTEGQAIAPEKARHMIDIEAARLGIKLTSHAELIRQIDDEAPHAYARWHKEVTGKDFDPATIPKPASPKERAAAQRKSRREFAREMREMDIEAEKQRLERLIGRQRSDDRSNA